MSSVLGKSELFNVVSVLICSVTTEHLQLASASLVSNIPYNPDTFHNVQIPLLNPGKCYQTEFHSLRP